MDDEKRKELAAFWEGMLLSYEVKDDEGVVCRLPTAGSRKVESITFQIADCTFRISQNGFSSFFLDMPKGGTMLIGPEGENAIIILGYGDG